MQNRRRRMTPKMRSQWFSPALGLVLGALMLADDVPNYRILPTAT